MAVSLQRRSYSESIVMFTASFLFRSTLVFLAASPTVAQQNKDMPGTTRGQYRPTGFTGKLTAYDLDEVVQRNKEKKRRGEAHAYSCFIVKEISERYYPTATFHWHQSRNAFRHIGVREKRDNTVQEIFLSWTSLSDSLQWGFFLGELERTRSTRGIQNVASKDAPHAKRTLFAAFGSPDTTVVTPTAT